MEINTCGNVLLALYLNHTQRNGANDMTNLAELLNDDIKAFHNVDIANLIGGDHVNYQDQAERLINECDDVETLKAVAIKFNGQREFQNAAEKLFDFIDESELESWCEENEINL